MTRPAGSIATVTLMGNARDPSPENAATKRPSSGLAVLPADGATACRRPP